MRRAGWLCLLIATAACGFDRAGGGGGVRSPAWVAAEFANQSDPASFYTVGPEDPL